MYFATKKAPFFPVQLSCYKTANVKAFFFSLPVFANKKGYSYANGEKATVKWLNPIFAQRKGKK